MILFKEILACGARTHGGELFGCDANQLFKTHTPKCLLFAVEVAFADAAEGAAEAVAAVEAAEAVEVAGMEYPRNVDMQRRASRTRRPMGAYEV